MTTELPKSAIRRDIPTEIMELFRSHSQLDIDKIQTYLSRRGHVPLSNIRTSLTWLAKGNKLTWQKRGVYGGGSAVMWFVPRDIPEAEVEQRTEPALWLMWGGYAI